MRARQKTATAAAVIRWCSRELAEIHKRPRRSLHNGVVKTWMEAKFCRTAKLMDGDACGL